MAQNSFKHRQFRTSIMLILLIAIFIAGGLFIQSKSVTQETIAPNRVMEDEVTENLERYRNRSDWEMSEVHAQASETVNQKVELVISGMADASTMSQLIPLLNRYSIAPTFFFSALEMTTRKESLSALSLASYNIGILGDGSSVELNARQGESVVGNLSRASSSMQLTCGIRPASMLVFRQPSEDLLYSAYNAGVSAVYVADTIVKSSDILTAADANAALADAPYHSILCLQLSARESNALESVELMLAALAKTDYTIAANNLMAEKRPPTEAVKYIYTTEPASALTFSGLDNSDELTGVLNALKSVAGKAIFFITKDDVANHLEDVQRILKDNHDLGIAIQTSGVNKVDTLLQEALLTQGVIQSELGYTKELPLRPVYGIPDALFLEAAGIGGFTVLDSYTPLSFTDYLRETNAQTILDGCWQSTRGVLRRGEVLHFYMNQFQHSNAVLGDIIRLIATDYNVYALRSAIDIINNDEYTYVYPVPEDQMHPSVRNKIYPGQLASASDEFEEIASRYIGISWVDRSSYLPGFTKEQIRKLDKKGLLPNDKNMVFLTFDDWGTDANINKLLEVLKRHKATATFYVRTNFVETNPNLLRVIALDGHAIGSHTDSHFPLSKLSDDKKLYHELTIEETFALRDDLILSYSKLQQIVGDVVVDGRPAITRTFRPPTLAVGFDGIQTVLDCGFTYCISGSFTSNDYNADSAEKLSNSLRRNTKSGAIIIMHMSDNSVHTADALDIYFTNLEQSSATKGKFSFNRICDALPNPE